MSGPVHLPDGPIILYHANGRCQRIERNEPWNYGFRRRFTDPGAHKPQLRLLKLALGYEGAVAWQDGFYTAACLLDPRLQDLPGLPVEVTVEVDGGAA
jgi:hypothetical protein